MDGEHTKVCACTMASDGKRWQAKKQAGNGQAMASNGTDCQNGFVVLVAPSAVARNSR
jgi:hypothetical protein